MMQPSIECPTPHIGAAQGIARVAVDDAAATLTVTFLRPVTPSEAVALEIPGNWMLAGGQRVFPRILTATVLSSSPPSTEQSQVILQLDTAGDFSIYTLIVNAPDIDPFFSSHKLRFRVACDDAFDCRPSVPPVAPPAQIQVNIDYLAKDYSSFRQALLDFIPTRLPAWTERSEADIGMMLLELLAYTADSLSYMQDRVANEAFLETATQRRSAAEHLALIGYAMDPGAAAYTWLQFTVTSLATLARSSRIQVSNEPRRSDEPLIIFETIAAARLDPQHNGMSLFSWGNVACCVPKTALTATLDGSFPDLRAGDYVVFDSGAEKRDIVRLSANASVIRSDSSPPRDLTLIRWSNATPLSMEHCVDTMRVRGNLVLATHGETIAEEPVRTFSPEQKSAIDAQIRSRRPGQKPPRQRVRLPLAPLAYIDAEVEAKAGAAPGTAAYNPRSVGTVSVQVEGSAERWMEVPTLLESGSDDPVFRVELEESGEATIVFGDGRYGRRPPESANVTATWRVGGGNAGNLAADTLVVARTPRTWLAGVTNPVPARGGRNPETREHAKRFGPPSLTGTLVAVTTGDYQNAAQTFQDDAGRKPIQRSKADFRWTGSWLAVTLALDPAQGRSLDDALRRRLLSWLDGRRLAGYDLDLIRPVDVPVELALEFCVTPGALAADVRQSLLETFGSGLLPSGNPAFFHPDNFSFGQPLFTSRIYAAAMTVPGVESVRITRLARQRAARPDLETAANLAAGALKVNADQIIRLDNDRNFPENGSLTVTLAGASA